MTGKSQNLPYDDIIHLPHHVSATRPQMPMSDRAAQFAPFSALTGFDASIREAERQLGGADEAGRERAGENWENWEGDL